MAIGNLSPLAFLRTRRPAGETWAEALRDPLLGTAAVVLVAAMVGAIVAMAAAILGLIVSFAVHPPFGLPLSDPAWDRIGALLLAVWALGVVAGGIGQVLAVVGTVAERRPFAPENAWRIERLAWRVIELAVIGWIAARLGLEVGGTVNGFAIGLGGGGNALAFALVLFVLARVFRQGNRLADEVEGTV